MPDNNNNSKNNNSQNKQGNMPDFFGGMKNADGKKGGKKKFNWSIL